MHRCILYLVEIQLFENVQKGCKKTIEKMVFEVKF